MNVEEERIEAWTAATIHTFESLVAKHELGFTVQATHVERVKWFARGCATWCWTSAFVRDVVAFHEFGDDERLGFRGWLALQR